MYFSDDIIDAVRSASDIVDVVGDYVRLKKRGSNYFGLCPFHSENTPSFSVNPAMGIFKCFGCGAGGDVFQFVMRVEGMSFPEAVRTLAEKAGVELPEEGASDRDRISETEAVYSALRFAARYFYHELTQTSGGSAALTYLRDRGFSKATIKEFGLGFAPNSWDALLEAAKQQHITVEVLEQAGLVIQRNDESGYYDRFRGRLIFPILSHVGKVLGFGGRIMEASSDQPKYINSPETRVYNKSRVLYGLYQAKHAIRKQEEVFLVEGYTDVISLHQAGIRNVVASSGTSLTRDQVTLLGRYAKRIVLVFDADAAGTGAAMRGIEIVIPEGMSAYIVTLPEGEDPDSFARREDVSMEAYLDEHRSDFVTYLHEVARLEGQLDTPEGEAENMHAILRIISSMPDPLMRETYLRRASDVLDVPEGRLHDVIGGLTPSRRANRRSHISRSPLPPQRPPDVSDVRERRRKRRREIAPHPSEKKLIRLMLEHGSSMVEFILRNMAINEFTEGPVRLTVEHFLEQYEAGTINRRAFLEGQYGTEVQELAAEVAMIRHEPSENWERKQRITVPKLDGDPYDAAASAMTYLKLDRVERAIEEKKKEQYEAQSRGEDVGPLQADIMELQQLQGRIRRQEFLEDE
ncbi:MAG: DNA primase [Rhodothermales bacterium]